jgi:hypothetical protein
MGSDLEFSFMTEIQVEPTQHYLAQVFRDEIYLEWRDRA